jgi:CheY-like chemotaxis protein
MAADASAADDDRWTEPRWRYLYLGGGGAIALGVVGALVATVGGPNWADGVRWILYMLAAAALSAILGLIFGLPRALAGFQPAATERYKGNSNLEEISDWLTKLLVGVGLVQLTQVPGLLKELSDFLSQGMTVSNASGYTSAGIVYGSAIGFVFAYLWSRLRLRYLFEFSDRQATLASTVQRVAKSLAQAAKGGDVREDPKKVQQVARQAVHRAAVAKDTVPILWVDDQPSNNAAIVAALRDLGISVDLALSTAEGLDRLARGTYSVAITDMGRTENGTFVRDAGEQFLVQARAQYPALPVLVFTSGRGLQRSKELTDKGAGLVTASASELFAEAVRLVTQ